MSEFVFSCSETVGGSGTNHSLLFQKTARKKKNAQKLSTIYFHGEQRFPNIDIQFEMVQYDPGCFKGSGPKLMEKENHNMEDQPLEMWSRTEISWVSLIMGTYYCGQPNGTLCAWRKIKGEIIGASGIGGEGLLLMDSEHFKEALQGAVAAYFTLDCSSEERKGTHRHVVTHTRTHMHLLYKHTHTHTHSHMYTQLNCNITGNL